MMTKERILVVDDSPESVWPLVEYLELDYRIVCATTPEKALALAFSEDRPDLILLDVVLPEMDGYQLFKNFKADAYTRDIPIIFLTGLTGQLDEVKGLDIGARDFIVKPYSLAVVGARIKSVLNLKKEIERRSFLKNRMEEMNRQLERQVGEKMKELEEARETLQSYEEKYEHLFAVAPSMPQLRKVLVVDDTPENIHILLEALEKEYQMFYATSGRSALKIVNSPDRPDVVLLDIMMPEMDGYEVCSLLKADASTWDIPVIFITGLDQELDETKGLNVGAIDFIVKPFSLPVVKARVKSALRLKEEMDNRIVLTRKLEDLNKNLDKRFQEKKVALKQANEELLANERRYCTLYETVIEGMFEVTPGGKMLSANPSLARILGYASPRELMDSIDNVAEQLYVHPRDRVRYVAELEKHGRIIDFETRLYRKQGDIIRVLICAHKNYSESGGGTTYQGFLIDISQRKKSQLKNRQHVRDLRLLNKIIAASAIRSGQPIGRRRRLRSLPPMTKHRSAADRCHHAGRRERRNARQKIMRRAEAAEGPLYVGVYQ
jgi:PAS domain S-box-containing protein